MSAITEIQERLFALADPGYKQFHSRLMPTVSPEAVIGVRTPLLRALAAEWAGKPLAEEFLRALPHRYYEENNLHALLIMREKDYGRALALVEDFLPYIDNWATCDTLRPRVFARHREELMEAIERWLASEHPYTVRFGLGMLMTHYLDDAFLPAYPARAAAVKSEEYYVKMMVAWYFATALAKQYRPTLTYLSKNNLEVWTHNKAIQKALESHRITTEQKTLLRKMKRTDKRN